MIVASGDGLFFEDAGWETVDAAGVFLAAVASGEYLANILMAGCVLRTVLTFRKRCLA
jgi:hypothetical protein